MSAALGVKAQKKAPANGAFGMKSEEWKKHCQQFDVATCKKSDQCPDA
ncbi:hypothetical protein [Tolumonas auensis]|nr:hypothetical protein [Tolumonas auensis]